MGSWSKNQNRFISQKGRPVKSWSFERFWDITNRLILCQGHETHPRYDNQEYPKKNQPTDEGLGAGAGARHHRGSATGISQSYKKNGSDGYSGPSTRGPLWPS